jgi:CBS domain-containing protein
VPDHGVAFRTVLRRFLRGPAWRGAERLEAYADLRNLLVHETVAPNGWLAVPTEVTVRRLEAIRDRLAGGRRADEAFRRPVETLARTTPLAEVLATAHRTGFSQFPVLDGGRVVGLLTDRGLARWWAAHVAADRGGLAAADVAGATAADVLAADADRATWATASGDDTAERVLERFVDAPTLEAVVITDEGRPDGALLGIATHLDVVRFWDEG